MKARKGFILRHLAGEWVLAPVGGQIKSFGGLAVMNELAAFLWEKMKDGTSRKELLSAILEEYDTDAETAARDLDDLLNDMREMGVIED